MQLIATVPTQPEPDIPPAALAPILTRTDTDPRWQLNPHPLATLPLPQLQQLLSRYARWRQQLERTWPLADPHICRQLSTTAPPSLYLLKQLRWEHATYPHNQLHHLAIQLHQKLERLDNLPPVTATIDRERGAVLRIDTPGTQLTGPQPLTLTVGHAELELTGPDSTNLGRLHSWKLHHPHPTPPHPHLAALLQLHTPGFTDIQLETISAADAGKLLASNLGAAAAYAQLAHRPLTITAAPLP